MKFIDSTHDLEKYLEPSLKNLMERVLQLQEETAKQQQQILSPAL